MTEPRASAWVWSKNVSGDTPSPRRGNRANPLKGIQKTEHLASCVLENETTATRHADGILFGPQALGPPMAIVEWIRASQAILFEASIVPAFVVTYAAVSAGAPFNAMVFGLILVSLVGVQAGAHLFKGFYEAHDRGSPPSSPRSWLPFASGSRGSLGRSPRTELR